jgi:chromosome segregation ATPase
MDSYKWFKALSGAILSLYKGEKKNPGTSLLEKTLDELLVANFKVWGYEDEVRRKDLPDKDIADLKRNIDRDNQKRNDLVDTIDAILRDDIGEKLKSVNSSLSLNSETPGSIFDRLTVLGLRTHSLKKEIERKDADISHIERCSRMLEEVRERSQDLLRCLEELLEDYYSGRKILKSYKQHKLYNDPDLNPSLRK